MGMLKEPPRSVWPNLSAGAVVKSNVLGTVVTLGAPGTLRTWDIPARGMEVPRAASWVSEAETSPCAERCQQAPASLEACRDRTSHPRVFGVPRCHPTASLFQGCFSELRFLAVASPAAVPPSLPAACARRSVPGQAGSGAATCLEELSEERHPLGPWLAGWHGDLCQLPAAHRGLCGPVGGRVA